jgi:hypothetical protein
VLVLVAELGTFSEMSVAALKKESPDLPVAVHVVTQGVPDETLSEARAVILPAGIATGPGEAIRLWLQNFAGTRFVVPTPLPGWVWPSENSSPLQFQIRQTAEMVRRMAEGEDISQERPSFSWIVFGYILGGFFGLVLLLGLFAILADIL